MVFSCRNRNIYYASRELLLVVDRAVIMVHSFFSRTFQCLIVCSQLFLVPFRLPTEEFKFKFFGMTMSILIP